MPMLMEVCAGCPGRVGRTGSAWRVRGAQVTEKAVTPGQRRAGVRPSQAEGELKGEKQFRGTAGTLGHQIPKACF